MITCSVDNPETLVGKKFKKQRVSKSKSFIRQSLKNSKKATSFKSREKAELAGKTQKNKYKQRRLQKASLNGTLQPDLRFAMLPSMIIKLTGMQLEPVVINLQDNYELQCLKTKADPSLSAFIQRNCPDPTNRTLLWLKLRALYGCPSRNEEKLPFNHLSRASAFIDHIKQVVISLLCEIDEVDNFRQVQKIKREADLHDLNEFQLQKKKLEIFDKELYEHIALHFLMYFVKKPLGEIISYLREIRKKIHYQADHQNQIFEMTKLYPKIDFPSNMGGQFICHCQVKSYDRQVQPIGIQETVLRCGQCFSVYHSKCQRNLLFCCRCHLIKNSAKSRIRETLKVFYILPNRFINVISFQTPDWQSQKMKHQRKWAIEIRVQRVNEMDRDIKTASSAVFLNNYAVYFNNQTIKASSRSLHAGEPIKIPDRILQKNNILIIKRLLKTLGNQLQETKKTHFTFIVGIFQVDKSAISAKPQPISQGQSLRLLESVMEKKQTNLMQVVLTHPQTFERITTPVRGLNCLHFECFDWKSYQTSVKGTSIRLLRKGFRRPRRIKYEGSSSVAETTVTKFKKGSINNFVVTQGYKDLITNKKAIDSLKKDQKKKLKCPICAMSIQKVYIDPIIARILLETLPSVTSIEIDRHGKYIKEDVDDQIGFVEFIDLQEVILP